MNYKIFFSIIFFVFATSVLIYLSQDTSSDDDSTEDDQSNTTLSYLNFMNSRPGGLLATRDLARFFDEE